MRGPRHGILSRTDSEDIARVLQFWSNVDVESLAPNTRHRDGGAERRRENGELSKVVKGERLQRRVRVDGTNNVLVHREIRRGQLYRL